MAASRSQNSSASGHVRGEESNQFLSVTELARLLNDTLEAQFPLALFRGEISQIQIAQSGHIYFTVKDASAQLSCVMWGGVARGLTFQPKIGLVVRCFAKPNIYGASGRFQMVVNRMTVDGEGDLQRKFLELKARLEAEGFFSVERKRALPGFPKAVGIVTSSTGAVIHDMMVKIRERLPSTTVYLVDTRVQGEGAAKEIAAAIATLNRSKLVDVIIVARGGGSLEDLWAFNEEVVVKAVFASMVPVVSGVGHESDTTLCDLAADLRAPTPTAAAEFVVPKRTDLLERIAELSRRLSDTDRWLHPRMQRVDELSMRLQARGEGVIAQMRLSVSSAEIKLSSIKPDRAISTLESKIALLESRLTQSSILAVQSANHSVAKLSAALQRSITPATFIQAKKQIEILVERLQNSVKINYRSNQQQLAHLAMQLESLSPQRVLDRGYGIVRVKGAVVKSVNSMAITEKIEVTLSDGAIVAKIEEITK